MIFSLLKNFIGSCLFRGIVTIATAGTMAVLDSGADFEHTLEAGLALNGISLITAYRNKKKKRQCTQIESILKNGLRIK